jgi:AbrB family looped-hinge helix DNA binding protein
MSTTHRYQFRLEVYSFAVMRDGSAMAFHGFVAVQGRGLVALPAEVRQRLHLDEPGAQVEITEREDGVLELRPALPIPADQRWFWQDRWQQREKEVDEHVAAGRVTVHNDGDAFLDHLDHLDAQAQADDAPPQP